MLGYTPLGTILPGYARDANLTATSSFTIDDFTLTATGGDVSTITGTTSVTIEDFTLTSEGTVASGITGDADITIDDFTLTAAGQDVSTITGTTSVTIDDFTLTATGGDVSAITGEASITLDDFTLTASSEEEVEEVTAYGGYIPPEDDSWIEREREYQREIKKRHKRIKRDIEEAYERHDGRNTKAAKALKKIEVKEAEPEIKKVAKRVSGALERTLGAGKRYDRERALIQSIDSTLLEIERLEIERQREIYLEEEEAAIAVLLLAA